MEVTQAQFVGLQVQVESNASSPRVVRAEEVEVVNLMPGCVHIFFKDGSRLFICNPTAYSDGLKFEVK